MPTSFAPAAVSTPATLAELHQLLDAGARWSATYRGRLSNHLPMAQQALLELGASLQRLHAWTAQYLPLLEPHEPVPPGAALASERELGRPECEPAWRAHFAARIAAVGAAATLHEALPRLLDGAGTIAFHGLIRTAHGVLAGHDGEIGTALAHWAAHWMPLPAAAEEVVGVDVPGALPPLALEDWLHGLQHLPRPAYPAGAIISDRMQAWGGTPGFAAVAGRLQRGPDTLRDLALLAARTYVATGNFTVLHLLTASHAMSVLQPWWPDAWPARGFTVAAAAGLLASGAAPALALEHPPGRPWPALIAAACAQDDAHVIKLTHAAWRLGRLWPDPAWRAAVERAVPV